MYSLLNHIDRRCMPRWWLGLCCLLGSTAGTAQAEPLWEITEVRQGKTGNFQYSLLHDATSNGGSSGGTLAYVGLDHDQFSYYDPNTGALKLHGRIYSDSALQNQIATVTAQSSDFDLDSLANTQATNDLVGALTLNFKFDNALSSLWQHVVYYGQSTSPQESTTTISFLDRGYTSGSHFANHFVPPGASSPGDLLLWGADGNLNNANFVGSSLGIDLALKFQRSTLTPEPATLATWALLSMLGGVGYRCRRRPRRANQGSRCSVNL